LFVSWSLGENNVSLLFLIFGLYGAGGVLLSLHLWMDDDDYTHIPFHLATSDSALIYDLYDG
jgi:hypothetical protein